MAAQGSTLDMSLFFGTEDEKQRFCYELLNLLKLRGCVKITNHSIPDEEVHKLFDMVCLALLTELKNSYANSSALDKEVLRAPS